ncbi:hypothetical protein [Herminiimonas sp. CN]
MDITIDLPTHAQLKHAEAVVNAYRAKAGNKIRILYVAPDISKSGRKSA